MFAKGFTVNRKELLDENETLRSALQRMRAELDEVLEDLDDDTDDEDDDEDEEEDADAGDE